MYYHPDYFGYAQAGSFPYGLGNFLFCVDTNDIQKTHAEIWRDF